MKTEFRKALLPGELRSLLAFDRKVFSESDRFPAAYWKACESYWLLVDNVKIGCCAFEEHVDFRDDAGEAGLNRRRAGSLYISTTGILPAYQGLGFGQMLKCWEISFARYHRFTRIVTNVRKRNRPMISLNQKFGFRTIRTSPRYYSDPEDSAVVMELRL